MSGDQERSLSGLQQSWSDDQDLKKKHARTPSTWLLTIGLAYSSLGVIYGDIGTSPLYTVSSIFANVDTLDKEDVIVGISMIFWTLTLVVLVKYVGVVLHANDKGEGGTFALYTHLCRTLGISAMGTMQTPEHSQLLTISKRPALGRMAMQPRKGLFTTSVSRYSRQPWTGSITNMSAPIMDRSSSPADMPPKTLQWWNTWHVPDEPIKRWFRGTKYAQRTLLCVAIIATSMVFGDGVLTPAVSVVSAVSGLEVGVEAVTTDVVVGVSCAILVVLFAFQFKGTAGVSLVFSPIVALWLGANAAIGIYNLTQHGPEIFKAFSPHYIYKFFQIYGVDGWRMLGAVMLAVTGAEAMFADLGHFDIPSVVISFIGYVYPCLVLTYFGQGAYLITHPEDVGTTYWSSIPSPVFWPMLVLATLASVVASQALITACYSICKQAKALGFFPKVKIVHTSLEADGQIYISSVNWILLVLTIAVVAGFNANSTKLGQAYGLTISVVMFITTLLTALTMITAWRVSLPLVLVFTSVFMLVDGAFVSANLTKVPEGGWVAIAISAGVATVFFVWWAGQRKRMSMTISNLRPRDIFTFTTVGAKKPLLHGDTAIATAPDTPPGEDPDTQPTTTRAPGPVAEHYDPCSTSGEWHDTATGDWDVTKTYSETATKTAAGPVAEGMITSPGPMERGAQDRESLDGVGLLGGAGVGKVKPGPSRDELGLLRGEFNLALNIKESSSKPLATLPGIALFYSDSPDTVPPVLCHFMRNVEAVHEINIFVSVRFLPIPTIDVDDRLLVRSVMGLPSFYQTVVRYGYMDTVDHGADFVKTLVSAVVHLLEHRTGLKHTPTIEIDGGGGAGAGAGAGSSRPGPVAEGLMDKASSSHRYDTPFLTARSVAHAAATAQDDQELQEIRVLRSTSTGGPLASPNLPAGPSMQVFQPPRLSIDMAHLSRILTATSLGHVLSRALPPTSPADGAKSPSGYDQLMHMARAIETGDAAYPPDLEDAARRVAALVKAANAGVVYFFGRTSLRMIPGSSLAHDILFDNLYKPMLLLSYAENEAWRVPVDNLVELGMVVYI